jgi:protein archease
MRSFQHIDHTADVGLKISATTVEELFLAAAEGMFEIILPTEFYSPVTATMDIRLSAENYDGLIREWLSELLYFHATRKMIFSNMKIWSISANNIEAIAEGFQMQESHFQHATEIKAVTYHALYVHETDDGYEAQVIFDT